MKQRLLSFVAIAALSCVAMAQTTWTPPVLDASKATELKSSETDRVYLYNVGAGQFLIGGTAWGTHAALGTGLPIRLTQNTDETWNIYFFEGSKNQQLLFRSTNDDVYIDFKGTGCQFWTITKAGDFYRIQTDINNATYGQEAMPGTYMGHSPSRDDKDSGGNVIADSHIGVWGNVTEDEEDAHIDWLIISEAAYQEYYSIVNLKTQLLSIINLIEEMEFEVDQKFINVLNNNNASLEEVQAAIDEIKPSFIETASEVASDDNPINVTPLFLINPDFAGKSTQGWTLTGAYAKTQNNSPHPIQEGDGVGEEGLDTGGWLEFWNSGGIDQYQDAHQVIDDLPAGSYLLQLVGCGTGGKLYAITNGIRQEATIPNNNVQRISFEFVHIGGDLTYGFDFTPASGSNPAWVAVDKFRLYYLGVGESPTITIMRSALETLDSYLQQEEGFRVGSTLFNEMLTLATQAQGLIENKSDDEELNTSVITNIQDMANRAAAEASAYVSLTEFKTNTLPSDKARFQTLAGISAAYATLYTKVTKDWEDAVASAIENYSWNKAQIEEFFSEYNDAVAQAATDYQAEVRTALDDAAAKVAAGEQLSAPLDITALYSALTFPSTKTLAKDLEDKYNWNWTQIEKFDDNDGLKFDHHTAEGWSCIFDANTTVKDLPAGKYTVKVNAFYRPMSTSLYEEKEYTGQDLAFFYVSNGVSTKQESILNWDNLLEFFPKTIVDDEEKDTRPNNQTAAHDLFTAGSEATQKTALELSAILRKGGDLTIGAKDIEGVASDCWVVWSDITLLYEGAIDADALDDAIASLIERAEELSEIEEVTFVEKAIGNLETAVSNGTKAIKEGGQKEKETAVEQLTNAIEYAEATTPLWRELSGYSEGESYVPGLAETYQNKIDNIEGMIFDDEKYPALLAEIIDLEGGYKSNEEIEDYIARIKAGWYPFLLSVQGLDEATEDDPFDMSLLINNATFDDMTGATKADPQGWTCKYESKDGGGRDGVAEFWNASAFNIYQEIPTLKDGYWRLSVDAVYRAGDAEKEAKDDNGNYKNDEYLYVNDLTTKIIQWSDTERGAIKPDDPETYTPIQQLYTQDGVQFDAPNSQANFLQFIEKGRYHNVLIFQYGEGIEDALSGSITIGLKKTVAVANDWCPFDNFKLEYLGTEQPTAVESLGTKAAAGAAISSIFSIDGRQQSQLRRGINIVRTADGKVTKVLVK